MKKKLMAILMVAMFSMLSVSLVFADVKQDVGVTTGDTNVGVTVTANPNATGGNATATGGNAQQNQDQSQAQSQTQNQNQNQKQQTKVQSVGNVRTINLPTVGFTPLPTPGTAPESGEWKVYCPPVYRDIEVKEFEKMQTGFKASNVLPWNWGGSIEAKAWGKVSSKKDSSQKDKDIMSCTCYWPKDQQEDQQARLIVTGDRVLAAGFHPGEAEQADDSFFADVATYCRKETGSSRFSVMKRDTNEGVTTGKSIGFSGTTSGVNDPGTSGVAFIAGGMLGKNRTSVEERSKMKFLCMNDGPTMCGQSSIQTTEVITVIEEAPAPTATVIPEPQAKSCNPDTQFDSEIKLCEFACYNNETLRFGKGNAKLDKYYCEGKKNKQLLLNALYEYDVAERDFKNGRELAPGQHFGDKPKGVYTPTLPEARETLYKVRYNRALVVRELNDVNGYEAEAAYARSVGLDKFGSMDMPSSQIDMKR